jgi:hypothetical protein
MGTRIKKERARWVPVSRLDLTQDTNSNEATRHADDAEKAAMRLNNCSSPKRNVPSVPIKREREEKEKHLPQNSRVKRPQLAEPLPVENLESVRVVNDTQAQFHNLLKQANRSCDRHIATIPPRNQIMAYIARHKERPPWYQSLKCMVAQGENIDFPELEVVTRQYIKQFLRAPVPGRVVERECINYDYDPTEGTLGMRCESHRLSAERLGPDKAFKSREFLLPSVWAKVMNAVHFNKTVRRTEKVNPEDWLPTPHEMCYLCHLRLTSVRYFALLSGHKEREDAEREQYGTDSDVSMILHKFMVPVDIPGEYDLRYTLMGDAQPLGIVGPYPVYNTTNYHCITTEFNMPGWSESDKVVFRPSPVSSPQRELSKQDALKASSHTMEKQVHFSTRP